MLTTRPGLRHGWAELAPAAAEQLGVGALSLPVVRPDGHIGLRADRDHLQALAAYHADAACVHVVLDGASCQNELFCDGGEFCFPQGQCATLEPPPCTTGQTCDEENDLCVQVAPTPTATPDGTATAAPTATAISTTPPTATATRVPSAATPTATAAAEICPGDCNGDRTVAINELVLDVTIALGNPAASACPAFDRDGDGSIAINELVAGVSSALTGCPV